MTGITPGRRWLARWWRVNGRPTGRRWLTAARRVMAEGGPAVWLSTAAMVVSVVALVVAVVTRPPTVVGATGPVGPTIGTTPHANTAVAPDPTRAPATSSATPTAEVAGCPQPTVTVDDAASLTAALDQATPGTVIAMADRVYTDRFRITASGTAEQPIYLCGAGAVIDGGDVNEGYALHLDGASHWRLVGFAVRNAQKGVMLDHAQHVVISSLTVERIGDEAIHLRAFSSDNVVEGNTIRDTGLRRDKFGEGVYIGSAKSNWCDISDCRPDASDRNIVRGNSISATTAESIDIKEGTTGGVISGNVFDGGSLSGSHADSWVDVKGNDWLIEANIGRNSIQDGFQTHQIVAGWGSNNTFTGNGAEVNGSGYGFRLTPVNGNKVRCDNTVTGAALGLANVACG
jgi:hypothetical protein